MPQLKEHSIPVVHDLPGVGAKLYDHPTVILRFKCKDGLDGKSLHYLTQPGQKNDARLAEAVDQFKKSLKGPLSSGVCNGGFIGLVITDRLFDARARMQLHSSDRRTTSSSPCLTILTR